MVDPGSIYDETGGAVEGIDGVASAFIFHIPNAIKHTIKFIIFS